MEPMAARSKLLLVSVAGKTSNYARIFVFDQLYQFKTGEVRVSARLQIRPEKAIRVPVSVRPFP
jgi:hypothetical protein